MQLLQSLVGSAHASCHGVTRGHMALWRRCSKLERLIKMRIVISLEQRLLEHHLNTAVVQFLISNNLPPVGSALRVL